MSHSPTQPLRCSRRSTCPSRSTLTQNVSDSAVTHTGRVEVRGHVRGTRSSLRQTPSDPHIGQVRWMRSPTSAQSRSASRGRLLSALSQPAVLLSWLRLGVQLRTATRPSEGTVRHAMLTNPISQTTCQSRGTYGSRRIPIRAHARPRAVPRSCRKPSLVPGRQTSRSECATHVSSSADPDPSPRLISSCEAVRWFRFCWSGLAQGRTGRSLARQSLGRPFAVPVVRPIGHQSPCRLSHRR